MDKNENQNKQKKLVSKTFKDGETKITKTKEKKTAKELFTVKEVALLLLITCFINTALFFLINGNQQKQSNLEVNSDTLKEIIKTYNYIKQNYYNEIDDKTLINGAIKGMTDALGDNYSEFISESSSDTYNITLQGEYYGVGIQISTLTSGEIVITSIIPNSPASKTDLQMGDIITKVNEKTTENMDSTALGTIIKGGSEENFTLGIKRGTVEKEITVKREKIILESVSSKVINKNNKKIGYIYIELFAFNTDKQFIEKLLELEKQNVDSIIIDVRGNSGGHLNAVTNIVSSFLDSSNVIYQMRLKDGTIEKTYSNGSKTKKYPIVVLGDSISASASEILISALKEKCGAKFVGKRTFGKGSVQELQTIESTGEQFKITTKKWLTANGNSIDQVGITPDYVVSMTDEYYNNPTDENDTQLQKALEVITK